MNAEAIRFWLELFLAAAAAAVIVMRVSSWSQRKFEDRVIDVVKESTRQIQPNANGGLSLSDVAKGVKEIRENQIVIAARIEEVGTELHERMDKSDRTRERIMRQMKQDRRSWVESMEEQGIKVPHDNPIDYKTRETS